MSKVTSKLQVTIPKALAERAHIQPGDSVDWSEAGRGLLLRPHSDGGALDVAARLRLFDAATQRQKTKSSRVRKAGGSNRGWTREELYTRGRAH